MKPSILVFLGIAITLPLLSTSCTMDDELQKPSKSDIDLKIESRSDNPPFHYYDNGLQGEEAVFGCTFPAINCAESAIVTGEKLNVVNDIFDNINVWSTSELQDYIDENSELVEEIIGDSETGGLISGSYNLRTRGTDAMEFRYLITRSGSTVISVTPIEN